MDAANMPVPLKQEVLFVGNSFVFVNDVPAHYRAIAESFSNEVRVESVTAGGYRLAQHAMDARTDGTELSRWLRTGTSAETSFDAVVLQEQSQIAGLLSEPERVASVAAATELAALARAHGSMVVLYMTWGYEHGDSTLPRTTWEHYEDMQQWIDDGYLELASHLREQGTNVDVAPVGGGFRLVFEGVTREGGDPVAEGSDFDALYQGDGIHPSARGAYLAACIIAGRISHTDVRSYPDDPALGAEVSNSLRDVCSRALVDPRWNVPTIHRPAAVLTGDQVWGAYFGGSVAINSDATRVLVGAPAFGGTSASARIFARGGSEWIEEAHWPGAVPFASSVALSGDGSRAFLGIPWRAYVREGARWTEDSAAVSIDSGVPFSLGASADGSRVIVGGAGPATETGVARIFSRSGPSWLEDALNANEASVDTFGPSVALDGTGSRAVVAANGTSAARVFARTDAGWLEEAVLHAPVAENSLDYAIVAISANANRIVVAIPRRQRAVVYARSGSTWAEEATFFSSTYDETFGHAIALSANGSRIAVGTSREWNATSGTSAGAVRIYDFDGATFSHTHQLLVATSGSERLPGLGLAVAITPDGRHVVAGAPHVSVGEGADSTWDIGKACLFDVPAHEP